MFYAICYDICDDQRRTRVAKVLKDYGERVQYSVFEALVSPAELERIQQRLRAIIDPKEDTVRFYTLCGSCAERIAILGEGTVTQDPDVIVI
jgi:CRISPR-associated protein Cas2